METVATQQSAFRPRRPPFRVPFSEPDPANVESAFSLIFGSVYARRFRKSPILANRAFVVRALLGFFPMSALWFAALPARATALKVWSK